MTSQHDRELAEVAPLLLEQHGTTITYLPYGRAAVPALPAIVSSAADHVETQNNELVYHDLLDVTIFAADWQAAGLGEFTIRDGMLRDEDPPDRPFGLRYAIYDLPSVKKFRFARRKREQMGMISPHN